MLKNKEIKKEMVYIVIIYFFFNLNYKTLKLHTDSSPAGETKSQIWKKIID